MPAATLLVVSVAFSVASRSALKDRATAPVVTRVLPRLLPPPPLPRLEADTPLEATASLPLLVETPLTLATTLATSLVTSRAMTLVTPTAERERVKARTASLLPLEEVHPDPARLVPVPVVKLELVLAERPVLEALSAVVLPDPSVEV